MREACGGSRGVALLNSSMPFERFCHRRHSASDGWPPVYSGGRNACCADKRAFNARAYFAPGENTRGPSADVQCFRGQCVVSGTPRECPSRGSPLTSLHSRALGSPRKSVERCSPAKRCVRNVCAMQLHRESGDRSRWHGTSNCGFRLQRQVKISDFRLPIPFSPRGGGGGGGRCAVSVGAHWAS